MWNIQISPKYLVNAEDEFFTSESGDELAFEV